MSDLVYMLNEVSSHMRESDLTNKCYIITGEEGCRNDPFFFLASPVALRSGGDTSS